jgi:hyperosmotically inducible protein
MKPYLIFCALLLLFTVTGCAPAVIGAGATGAYKAGTDERSVGRMWDDSAITTKINAELLKDPLTKARKIDVDTLQGEVILTGVVETQEASKRAVEIARQVPGVKRVKNNLQVGSKSFGQAIDDKVIGSKIKGKLLKEPGIRSLNIDVDVHNGVVSLTGTVDSQHQKARVMEIASTTSGTVNVIDNIKVLQP